MYLPQSLTKISKTQFWGTEIFSKQSSILNFISITDLKVVKAFALELVLYLPNSIKWFYLPTATSTALIEAMFCILVTWNERFTQKFCVNQFLSCQFLIKTTTITKTKTISCFTLLQRQNPLITFYKPNSTMQKNEA